MSRVLLLSTTTGYQLRSFNDAAEQLGIELVFATDRCQQLDDPWRDRAIAVRFHEEAASIDAIVADARRSPFHGVLAVGDRPAILAARVAERLGLPGNPPEAAAASSNKLEARQRLAAAGLAVPSYFTLPAGGDGRRAAADARMVFPCVLKPLGLSGSRGVIRADSPEAVCGGLRPHQRPARARGRARGEDGARERRARRAIHPGTRVRRRGSADRRKPAGLCDFRQARPARRSLLRGDDLRHAIIARSGQPGSSRVDHPAGHRRDRTLARARSRRMPGGSRWHLRTRSRGAADRRPVLEGAAVRGSAPRSSTCSCGTRSARTCRAHGSRPRQQPS